MSMLSSQIDELRKAAEYYDGSEVAAIMRYAADTIWQLRDDLQRANDEYAELRDGYGSMSREHSQTIIELSDAHYRIDQLNAENAKLREALQRRNEQFEGMTEMWVERGVDNAKLLELVRDYHTFLALVELARPIDYVIAASGHHQTLSVAALDKRYRELIDLAKAVKADSQRLAELQRHASKLGVEVEP